MAPLAYFMLDREEDVWVRRHVPSTLALLPFPASVAALMSALDDSDGFLKFKAVSALENIRRSNPELAIDAEAVTRHVNAEAGRAFDALTLHYNLFVAGGLDTDSLLARSLTEKHNRRLGRTFQLLGPDQHPVGHCRRSQLAERQRPARSARAASSTSTTCWRATSASG